MMIPRIREYLWTQTKKLMNLIQLYEEAFVEGDHHLSATYRIMRSERSVEGKTAYLLEQNAHVCVSHAECIEENISDPKAAI